MAQKTLENIFDSYLSSNKVFNNKEALTIRFNPGTISHRNTQIEQLGTILAPSLKNDRPSNVFIYGTTGTGKTLVSKYVIEELLKMAKKSNSNIITLYVNCKMKRVADTEYRLLAYLCEQLGKRVPATGLPTDQIYKTFFSALEERKGVVILLLDEIDSLIYKVGDELLYNLTRINQEILKSKVAIIGISNDLSFTENLDARVKSSLSEEELIFPPYNAMQLQEILTERSKIAFSKGVLGEGVISKCAALAAQEHGDARRALNLLRVAGELAEREGAEKITEKHVDLAESKIDMEHVLEAVKTMPKQSKAVLLSVIRLNFKKFQKVTSGDIYDDYNKIAMNVGFKPLTQRRVSDLISELEMLSIINSRTISRGRQGRTRIIQLAITSKVLEKVNEYLKKEFYLS